MHDVNSTNWIYDMQCLWLFMKKSQFIGIEYFGNRVPDSGFPSLHSLYYPGIHLEFIVLKPIKSLGQNFLRDENILNNIVKSLDLQAGDVVVEIGPGQGALTSHLTGPSLTVIGIEVDERAVRLLQDRFGGTLELVQGDVLKIDLPALARRHGGTVRVVGNIP
ncbi:MAG: hypothetical protein EHM64_11220, partial [Ignavibacteriae bacterium]